MKALMNLLGPLLGGGAPKPQAVMPKPPAVIPPAGETNKERNPADLALAKVATAETPSTGTPAPAAAPVASTAPAPAPVAPPAAAPAPTAATASSPDSLQQTILEQAKQLGPMLEGSPERIAGFMEQLIGNLVGGNPQQAKPATV